MILLLWLWQFCGRNPLTVMFMVGTAAAVAITFADRRAEPRLFRLALWNAAMWVGAIALHRQLGPAFRQAYPVMDFVLSVICLLEIVKHNGGRIFAPSARPDLLVLCALMSQMALHVLFPTHLPLETRYPYLVALNLLYGVVLGALTSRGARRFGNLVFAGLAPRSRAHRLGSAQ